MSALTKPVQKESAVSGASNWLLYDGECPFCSRYVQLVRVRDAVGSLKVLNARDGGPELEEVRSAGLNLDEGMVLKLSGRLYHGHDCIHALALLSEPIGSFNRLNAWVFKSPGRAAALYPVLRTGRNMVLALMGRKKLDQVKRLTDPCG